MAQVLPAKRGMRMRYTECANAKGQKGKATENQLQEKSVLQSASGGIGPSICMQFAYRFGVEWHGCLYPRTDSNQHPARVELQKT
jgi:hypothetical protein